MKTADRTNGAPPVAGLARRDFLKVGAGFSLALTLATFKGTRSELAKHLGISDRTLYRRLKEQGLA